MARDIGDGIEIRMITKLKLMTMATPVLLNVFQARHTDDPNDPPSIGIAIDLIEDSDDSLVAIMDLQEAALIAQSIQLAIQDVLSLYADSQSGDLLLQTLRNAGGPNQGRADDE